MGTEPGERSNEDRIADLEDTVKDLQARCQRYEAAMVAAAGALRSSDPGSL